MEELLEVLARWLAFFFTDNRYRLVHSDVGVSFGDALVEFASSTLRWRLTRDRSQVILECQTVSSKGKRSEWFSADLLMRLVAGRAPKPAVLTAEMSDWLRENLRSVEGRFSAGRLEATIEELRQLKRVRSKELFG